MFTDTEPDEGRVERSVAICTVQSPSSSVSASSIVADNSDWSPEQLLRLKAAADDRSSSPGTVKRLRITKHMGNFCISFGSQRALN